MYIWLYTPKIFIKVYNNTLLYFINIEIIQNIWFEYEKYI